MCCTCFTDWQELWCRFGFKLAGVHVAVAGVVDISLGPPVTQSVEADIENDTSTVHSVHCFKCTGASSYTSRLMCHMTGHPY